MPPTDIPILAASLKQFVESFRQTATPAGEPPASDPSSDACPADGDRSAGPPPILQQLEPAGMIAVNEASALSPADGSKGKGAEEPVGGAGPRPASARFLAETGPVRTGPMMRVKRRLRDHHPRPADEMDRRRRLFRLAGAAYPDNRELVAFATSFDSRIGGKPLDIATASELGLSFVAAMLEQPRPHALIPMVGAVSP